MYLIFILYALFASVFTTAKVGLQYTTPWFLVGSRMAVAGVILLAYQYIFHRNQFSFSRKSIWRVIQLATFNIYLTNVLEFWGLQYLTSFKTCFIYSLSPFISALFSYIMFTEKMTGKKWIGMLIGFAGMAPILLLSESSSEHASGTFFYLSWAEISVITAAVMSVYGWVVLRQLIKVDGMAPTMANGLGMLLGGAMGLTHSLFVDTWDPIPVTNYRPFLEAAILLIIISNFICYNLYGYLLQRYTATFLSFAGWMTPLFTAFFGWIILGETVSWPFYASAGIVLIGLVLFYQEELKQGYYAKSAPADSKSKECSAST